MLQLFVTQQHCAFTPSRAIYVFMSDTTKHAALRLVHRNTSLVRERLEHAKKHSMEFHKKEVSCRLFVMTGFLHSPPLALLGGEAQSEGGPHADGLCVSKNDCPPKGTLPKGDRLSKGDCPPKGTLPKGDRLPKGDCLSTGSPSSANPSPPTGPHTDNRLPTRGHYLEIGRAHV